MPLLTRKRAITAKIETTYGTDATPTGASNAILINNPQVMPMEMTLVQRNNIKAYLGDNPQAVAAVNAKVSFGVEVAGSGTPGTAPAYGPLLRGCGMAETAFATQITGTAIAGGATTITLAAGASAVDSAYVGMTLNVTGGTGLGQSAVIKSYVGSTKVATFTATLTTPLDATSVYLIPAQVIYMPISSSFESITIYVNVDGVLHTLLGARGTVQIDLPLQGIPQFKFTFTGVFVPVADSVAPALTLTAFQAPLVLNNVNSSGLVISGYSAAVAANMMFDIGNAVIFRSLVNGAENVMITDRKVVGSVNIEATTVASKNWWSLIKGATMGNYSLMHGTTAGNRVKIDAPSIQLTKPAYQDTNGVTMLQASMDLVPLLGNDEIVLSIQ